MPLSSAIRGTDELRKTDLDSESASKFKILISGKNIILFLNL